MSSNTGPTPGDIFDVKKIRKFIELMNEHDLAEIDLKQGEQRIRLRKPEATTLSALPAIPAVPVVPPPAAVAAGEKKAADSAIDQSKFIVIKSPMVGTFYASPNPESPAFVKVGDRVGPDTTVCIVEAMKVFNELPAECSGRIAAVLAQSGDAVEFNQPLFRVEPN